MARPAGQPYLVTRHQTARVPEGRPVAGTAADQRQVLDMEGGQHQSGQDGQTDRADHDRVALAEGLHPPPPQRAAPELNVAGLTLRPSGRPTRPSKSHKKKLNQEPYDAVRVSASYRPGSRLRVSSMAPLLALSVPATRLSMSTSDAMDGRASRSRPAVASARSPMLPSALPIAVRSAARPDTKSCNWRIVSLSCSSRSFSVPSTALRLAMTRPTAASRSASALVSEAVRRSRLATVPPSPCRTWITSCARLLTSCGVSAVNSGRLLIVHSERELREPVVHQPDRGQLPDPDAGDPHVVAVQHAGDVGEPGPV